MIYQIIKDSIVGSMKSGKKEKVGFLRYLDANIQSTVMDKRLQEANDEVVIGVLQKEHKKIVEELAHYKDENETTQKLKRQIEIIESILPKEIPEDELEQLVDDITCRLDDIIDGEVSMKLMGKIIKEISERDTRVLNKSKLSTILKRKMG